MKISAIIPTYNRSQFILDAIKSIQNQSFQVDEIIIIDDGSNDETKSLLQSLHVTYIFQANNGVSSARNRGIQEAKNEWIAFLDSDDTWEKDKIQAHINFHKNNPFFLASFTDEIWIKNDKEVKLKRHQKKEQPTFLNSLRNCKIGTSTFFAHKSIFETVGYFDESLVACEDYDLWLRILLSFPIGFIDKKLTKKHAKALNQLSFTTAFLDTYRIKALLKHKNTKYEKEVIEELEYKLHILQKGALKHNNTKLLQFCDNIQKKIIRRVPD
jgi:glycosyltransferase involved in cell wall biosynthesis